VTDFFSRQGNICRFPRGKQNGHFPSKKPKARQKDLAKSAKVSRVFVVQQKLT
jgi:hypothetical protein